MACKIGVCYLKPNPAQRPSPMAMVGPMRARSVAPSPAGRAASPAPPTQAPSDAFIRASVDLYGQLSEVDRAAINTQFQGSPRNDANNLAWCKAVQAAFARSGRSNVRPTPVPPAGSISPFVGDPTSAEDCDLNAANGFRWDASRRRCVDNGSVVGDLQQSSVDFGGYDTRLSTDAPTDSPGPDHTGDYISGIVAGLVGIGQVVQHVIDSQNADDFRRFMAGLQAQQASAQLQARQGDREASIQLARINQAIAESQSRAASANAAAVASGRQAPFPPELLAALKPAVPMWAIALGVGVLAVAVVGLGIIVVRQPQPQQLPQPQR